jgi:hypothetical protein
VRVDREQAMERDSTCYRNPSLSFVPLKATWLEYVSIQKKSREKDKEKE